ncbi:MAG: hypothetical protein ACYTEV_11020 [Planctomycetota bacterium]
MAGRAGRSVGSHKEHVMTLNKGRLLAGAGIAVCCVLVVADGVGLLPKPSPSSAGPTQAMAVSAVGSGSGGVAPGGSPPSTDSGWLDSPRSRHLRAVLGAGAESGSGVLEVEGFDGRTAGLVGTLDDGRSVLFWVAEVEPAFTHAGIDVWLGHALVVGDSGGVPSPFVAYSRPEQASSFVSLLDETTMRQAREHVRVRNAVAGWHAAADDPDISEEELEELLEELDEGPENDPAIGDPPVDHCQQQHPGDDCRSLVARDICRCTTAYGDAWDLAWAGCRDAKAGCAEDYDKGLRALGLVTGVNALACLVDIWIPGAGTAAAAICLGKTAVLAGVDLYVLNAEFEDCMQHAHGSFVSEERLLVARLRHCRRMAEARDCDGGDGDGGGGGDAGGDPDEPQRGVERL